MRHITAALLLILSSSANAALLSSAGGQAYYDDVLDITWVADANLAKTSGYDADGLQNFADAQTWIGSLNTASYLGVSNWRLPASLYVDSSCSSPTDGWPGSSGANCTGSEMGHLYYVDGKTASQPAPFSNVQSSNYYWSGTDYGSSGALSYVFLFNNSGAQSGDGKATGHFAWAVRDGAISAVPAPAAVWLLGTGLAGLGGRRWLRRKISS